MPGFDGKPANKGRRESFKPRQSIVGHGIGIGNVNGFGTLGGGVEEEEEGEW